MRLDSWIPKMRTLLKMPGRRSRLLYRLKRKRLWESLRCDEGCSHLLRLQLLRFRSDTQAGSGRESDTKSGPLPCGPSMNWATRHEQKELYAWSYHKCGCSGNNPARSCDYFSSSSQTPVLIDVAVLVWRDALKAELEDWMEEEEIEFAGDNGGKQVFMVWYFYLTTLGRLETPRRILGSRQLPTVLWFRSPYIYGRLVFLEVTSLVGSSLAGLAKSTQTIHGRWFRWQVSHGFCNRSVWCLRAQNVEDNNGFWDLRRRIYMDERGAAEFFYCLTWCCGLCTGTLSTTKACVLLPEHRSFMSYNLDGDCVPLGEESPLEANAWHLLNSEPDLIAFDDAMKTAQIFIVAMDANYAKETLYI